MSKTTTPAPTESELPGSEPIEHPTLAAALAAFQGECPPIRKGNRAVVPTKSGGQYSYDYADLSDVLEVVSPVLSRHGLSFNGRPTVSKHGFGLKYRLRHVSGESERGFYPLPDPGRLPAQDMGSWLTYVRRYVLCAVVGVAPGGDDNDAAVQDPWAPREAAQQRQQRPRAREAAPARQKRQEDPQAAAAASLPDEVAQTFLERGEAAADREALSVVWQEARAAGASQELLGRIAGFADRLKKAAAAKPKGATVATAEGVVVAEQRHVEADGS